MTKVATAASSAIIATSLAILMAQPPFPASNGNGSMVGSGMARHRDVMVMRIVPTICVCPPPFLFYSLQLQIESVFKRLQRIAKAIVVGFQLCGDHW